MLGTCERTRATQVLNRKWDHGPKLSWKKKNVRTTEQETMDIERQHIQGSEIEEPDPEKGWWVFGFRKVTHTSCNRRENKNMGAKPVAPRSGWAGTGKVLASEGAFY